MDRLAFCLSLITCLAVSNAASGQGLDALVEEQPVAKTDAAFTAGWNEGLATVGSVAVDPESKTVMANGWVNQVSGAIELLACGPGGKTHETIFVLDVNPLDLQTAFLLLGVKPGTPPAGLGTGMPRGPKIDIWVDWPDGAVTNSRRAGDFVWNWPARKRMKRVPWIFTGSVIEEGEFKALAEQSLVATYWDPWAIINIGHKVGADDEILSVNTNLVPPLHTPVRFRFRAR